MDRAVGVAYDAKLSPVLQQSLQDWDVCRAIFHWTFCTCPWNGQQGSDCRDAQIERRESASTSLQAWKTGKRLLHAQPHCDKSTIRNGSMEWECGKERGNLARTTEALSGLDKDRTGSKRTQETTVLLHETEFD